MSVNFTLDDVVAKVREVAADRPDYVYEKPSDDENGEYGTFECYYRHGDEPGCIVGVALGRLGYVVPDKWEGSNAKSLLMELFDTEFDAQIAWVWSVQREQDDGKPWGEAVEDSDSYVRLGVA